MNRNQLKYIAAFAMLIDHLAWAFVPTAGMAGQAMHFIGRLADPVMAFFVAEGYLHTRSVKNYARRLFLFALISQLPYSLFRRACALPPGLNVIYTLLLGLLAVWLWDACGWKPVQKVLAVFALCILSLPGDWSFMNVLWPLCFFVFRGNAREKWLSYWILAALYAGCMIMWQGTEALFFLGLLCAPLVLRRCSGAPGSGASFHRWFFYLFYPGHLLLISLLMA